jgi:GNAT superfamily N-acetyltransferase
MQRIIQVTKEGPELNIVRQLFLEYAGELNVDLRFQHFQEEVDDPLKKYGQPHGTVLLCYWNNEPAGCIAYTPMPEAGCCEMKRLFVRPSFRKYGMGRKLIQELIDQAKVKGYCTMRLDTLTKLQAAIRLYEDLGFYYIPPYYHNPLPEVVFMEREL